jgi:hypothetical protein
MKCRFKRHYKTLWRLTGKTLIHNSAHAKNAPRKILISLPNLTGTRTHNFPTSRDWWFEPLKSKRKRSIGEYLKILVSVVRFRLGPPRISIAHLLGYFLLWLGTARQPLCNDFVWSAIQIRYSSYSYSLL